MTYNGLDEVLGWIDQAERYEKTSLRRMYRCDRSYTELYLAALYTCRFLYDLLDLFARSHFYPRRLLFFFAVDIAFIYHRLSFCYPFTSLLNYLPKNLYVTSNIQLK